MRKKYFVSELFPGQKFNAAVGRQDIETLLSAWSFNRIDFDEGSKGFAAKLSLYVCLFQAAKNIRDGDVVFFHLPLFSRVKKIFFNIIKLKGAITIAYVNDLEGLRDQQPLHLEKELKTLSRFSGAVVLNDVMADFIANQCPSLKLASLPIWDYLIKDIPASNRTKNFEIAFVGNQGKAAFINQLYSLPELTFHLYGSPGLNSYSRNCMVHGEVDSKALVADCKGSFGLVWDGPSIDSCEGGPGTYLRINSPYKLSFYLLAGLPIIIWKGAALAEWVIKNNLGFTVDSLLSIPKAIDALTEHDYQQMRESIKAVQPSIAEGHHLKNALEKLIG